MSKSIYTFNVKKPTKAEEKRVEKYTDEGVEKERTITEVVEKTVDVEIVLREPNRRQIQEAEFVYSVEMSKSIKQGILTKAMLLNKYKDSGGLVSEQDHKELAEKYKELDSMNIEVVTLRAAAEDSEEQKAKLLDLEAKLISVKKEIIMRETSYLNLFNHTADTRAQNRSILWYVLHLSYYKDPTKGHKDLVPLFEGKTFEEKEEYLMKLEENSDSLYNEVYPKLADVFSLWFFSDRPTKEDFDKIVSERS